MKYILKGNIVINSESEASTYKEIIDGSPRGVYANLSALQTAFPTGTSGVYLTSDDGHWHYWNGTAWADGGVYQAVEIADGSVTPEKTNFLKRNSENVTKLLSILEKNMDGVTIEIQDDYLVFNGTAENGGNCFVRINNINSGNYYCTLYTYGAVSTNGVARFNYNTTTAITSSININQYKNKLIELKSESNALFFFFGSNTIFNNYKIKIMVSQNLITKYESYDIYSFAQNIKVNDYVMNFLYVSNDYDTSTEGYGISKFKTLYDANESILNNDSYNRYTIIVKKGTYIDLQTKYNGVIGTDYQGICCKDYVYYESEDINHPEECIINWDGATGYSLPVSDEQIRNKCPFHIVYYSNHTHIKGFTFNIKNCRYALHIESSGATSPINYIIENCVFNWEGRPNQNTVNIAYPAIGTGFTNGNVGKFINCEFNNLGTTEYDNMIWQSHDNKNNPTGVSIGEEVEFINCYFNVYGEKAIFNPRAYINSNYVIPKINNLLKFINCSGKEKEINQTSSTIKYHIIDL